MAREFFRDFMKHYVEDRVKKIWDYLNRKEQARIREQNRERDMQRLAHQRKIQEAIDAVRKARNLRKMPRPRVEDVEFPDIYARFGIPSRPDRRQRQQPAPRNDPANIAVIAEEV